MLRLSRLAPLALMASLALVGCQDNKLTGPNRTTTPIGTGQGFTLLLTDAPGDFEAAVVTISQVYLQGTGGASVNLLDHPFTGDLLDLQNQVATLVRGFDLPAGSYSQLRLVLDGAYIQVATESGSKIFASSPNYAGLPAGAHVDGTLQMPSMGTSGLKIDLPGGKLDIGAGETIVMIDFNAHQSFGHEAGNSGRWVMHPVVKATNVTFGGNVLARLQLGSGVTLPLMNGQQLTLGGFQAVLTPVGGGAPVQVALTDANNDGIFEALFKGLVPGSYTLSFVSPTGLFVTYAPTLPVTVTVTQRQTTTETVNITSAALPSTITATLALGAGVTLPSVGTPPVPVTLTQFKAQLTPAGGTAIEVPFTLVSGTYQASFTNLAPGTYSLTIVKPTGTTITYDVAVPVSVPVTGGQTIVKPFVITAATAP